MEAAYATEIHDLNIELKALKYMAAPLHTAKGTIEAAHTKEVHELKTEIKALTTSVTPLQTAIEGLAVSITRLQVDKVSMDYEAASEMNRNDHHGGATAQTPAKESIDDTSRFSAEVGPTPSERSEIENEREEVLRDACEENADSEYEGETEMNNAEADNLEEDDADVYTPNQDDSSASNTDADDRDAWRTFPNENNSNNSAGATEDSLSDNNLASNDSWIDLESLSPSTNEPDSVDSE